MDTTQTPHDLPAGFHWEAPFAGSIFPSHLVAVPDEDAEAWLATVTPQREGHCAVATIRRHLGVRDHVSRPFRTEAAAANWVARWLSAQGESVRAELSACA